MVVEAEPMVSREDVDYVLVGVKPELKVVE